MSARTLRDDDRALGLGIVIFFAILVVGALMWIVLQPAVNELESLLLVQSDSVQSQDVIEERALIFGNILFYVIFAGALFLISRATFEARGP